MMSLAAAPVRLTATSAPAIRSVGNRFSKVMSSAAAGAAASGGGVGSANTSRHYKSHTSDTYESAFFYSPGEYTSKLAALVREALCIPHPGDEDGGSTTGRSAPAASSHGPSTGASSKRRIVDIGGGTGNFTRMLVDHPGSGSEAVVIDPFLEKSSSVEEGESVTFVKASAEDFAADEKRDEWWRSNYHQVLLKEVVHHISDEDRAKVFRGMREGTMSDLPPGDPPAAAGGAAAADSSSPPSILIVTRPQRDIDYPLWPEARAVWAANQPSASAIQSSLAEAGYSGISHVVHPYPCEIELERWLDMVKGRFWSTFSNFSDGELEEACTRIREERKKEARGDKGGRIRFEDRLVFITARR